MTDTMAGMPAESSQVALRLPLKLREFYQEVAAEEGVTEAHVLRRALEREKERLQSLK